MVKHYLHNLSAPFSLRRVLLAALLLLIGTTASAYDFAVENADGVTIYYNKLYGGGVAVTSGPSEYSGIVNIPSSVRYGGTSYSVTSIGERAFYSCDGLTEVTIPNSVTSIGEKAFGYCFGLIEVTIPNSVTSIKSDAFAYCTGLTEVTIPNSVTSIGESAFSGCSELTEVTIPNSVTSIGGRAFSGCSGLTEITIPNSVTSIGDSAFRGCSGLTEMTVDSNNTFYDSRENCNSIIESASNTLIFGCMNSKIPNSVTSIGESAFEGCSGLTEVTIPESVTSIGEYAFYNCSGLTEITIPNSVTSIGRHAFTDCSGLTEVTIPNSVTSIGEYAFRGCSGLTEMTVDSNNTVYDSRENCNSIIKSASNTLIFGCMNSKIPNSVTSIGESAFFGCTGLTEITIPNSVTSIGYQAFSYCSGLTEIKIPESVTSIEFAAFRYCTGLTEVNFNAIHCSDMGTSFHPVFEGCNNLQKLTIGNNVEWIPDYIFYGCTGLTEVNFNATYCTKIGKSNKGYLGAFAYCNNLRKLTIGNNVKSIPDCAFENCTGLTELYFNATNCSDMGSYNGFVFQGCTNLQKLTIGNNVKTIPDYAFSHCTGLTEITIPNSVTSIGERAFNYCTGLTEVNFNATNCSDMGSYHGTVFQGCNNLQKLTIGNNVKSIPDYAFMNCTGLTEITIPESVTDIGYYAFYNSVIGPDRCIAKTRSTESTISTTIDTKPSVWNCNKQFYIQCGSKEYELNGEEITIDELTPGRDYNIDINIVINGCKTKLTNFEYTTKDISISVQTSKTATSTMVTLNVDSGDAVVAKQYISDGSKILPTYITGLDPNTTYTYNYIVEGESWTRKKEFTVKTDELTMLTLPGQAMNTTTALLCAETNICDDEVNVGFEWRQHDAPSTLPSNKVACAAIDGTITGALSGLNPEVYYNYRPYYTSNSGKTYYGEWITFFTGDANVFFDPTVKTYSAEVLDDYSAVLKGYALRGSEEIASQGFQYWKSWGAPNGSRSNEVVEVEVNGQKLSCTISDLEPGSTYTYRTFVKTASGITYGEEMTFDTPGSAGIEETIAETTEVEITGYYNLQGVKSDRPFSGFNIVSYSDGTTKKVIYRK